MSGFTDGYDALYDSATDLRRRRSTIAGDGALEAQTAIDAAVRIIDLLMAGLLVAESDTENSEEAYRFMGTPLDRH